MCCFGCGWVLLQLVQPFFGSSCGCIGRYRTYYVGALAGLSCLFWWWLGSDASCEPVWREQPFVLDQTFTLAATTNSGLPITYASSNTAVISISGTTATIKGPGQAIITASQAGDATYAPAQDVTQIQVIAPAAPTATAATVIKTGGFRGKWIASAGGADEYWFSYSTDINFTNETVASASTSLYKDISNLLANTTYYYRIQAKFGTVYSPYSNTITVTTAVGIQTYDINQSVNGFTKSIKTKRHELQLWSTRRKPHHTPIPTRWPRYLRP